MSNSSNSSGVSLGTVLLVVFVVLKLTGVIAWSWLWVLSPMWIPFTILLLGLAIIWSFRAATRMTLKQSTPTFIIRIMAHLPGMLSAVLRNPGTPTDLLRKHAKKGNRRLLYLIAANPNADLETLNLLAMRNEERTFQSMLENPKLPPEMLKLIPQSLKQSLLFNRHSETSAISLENLSNDEVVDIRHQVAVQSHLPKDIREKLKIDVNEKVREAAEKFSK